MKEKVKMLWAKELSNSLRILGSVLKELSFHSRWSHWCPSLVMDSVLRFHFRLPSKKVLPPPPPPPHTHTLSLSQPERESAYMTAGRPTNTHKYCCYHLLEVEICVIKVSSLVRSRLKDHAKTTDGRQWNGGRSCEGQKWSFGRCGEFWGWWVRSLFCMFYMDAKIIDPHTFMFAYAIPSF